MVAQRWAWTAAGEFLAFRLGRLYETLYYSQYNNKYWMALIIPGWFCTTRWRAEHQLHYYVFIDSANILPDTSSWLWGSWGQGTKYYLPDNAKVKDLYKAVYGEDKKVPSNVRAGCRGRMMDDDDTLAMAVHAFCKRDPKIQIWEEDGTIHM
ncbi:unnamed protein product [Vitrella brassicaformis CCMP3155]|uniref:Uncharacterized protein n=2 Tax=Vitrella brassicaformis TaxID=1169539 RepID=A0A0G4EZ38_VITBC|nr:unnamed protein product [Vitrella brassicaformis CCMP3155]|mmetsp:Transcript_24517/g.60588  ORF Transcript_24517/g.60588 Transcript_24517/m.60588 type:complete len:152 (+) Transcript_24517:136-591(+)|eukprot:CEM03831.1 unnamed protein product [Vitrella brassicaformis CCMP3155]